MLDRKIDNRLKAWKNTPNRKALLIKGARQVGKTTIVRSFGKGHYKNYVEINFEKTPLARQAFAGNLDAKTIILNLSAMGYGSFVKGETLFCHVVFLHFFVTLEPRYFVTTLQI